jgi:hypothetical protein
MSKNSKNNKKFCSKNRKQEVQLTLYERVDFDVLDRLISADELQEDIRKLLKMYLRKKDNKYIPVNYTYSNKLIDYGRLYAQHNLSLQYFKREIRHTLAKDYYIDVDMKNAGANIIYQYCRKYKIKCKKLREYVKDRENILLEIQDNHKINREESKDLMLRLLYLGSYKINDKTPKDKMDFLIDFRNEMKEIGNQVCDREKEIYESINKDSDREYKQSSTLSIKCHMIENECLLAMYDFFINNDYKVGVLCFDGLMIEKDKNLNKLTDYDELLIDCEKYVYNKTDYKISHYVKSDLECVSRLFQIEGKDTFKFCNGILYIFDERDGLYSTQKQILFYYLIKNKDKLIKITPVGKDRNKEESYGEESQLMKKVIPIIETETIDNEWIDREQNSSLGYLLFKNGIYNMKTGKFNDGFDKKIVFHARIPWEYKEKDEKKMKKANELSFHQLFDHPKQMIAAIARAIAGDVKAKKIYFCPGKTDSGKSTFIEMLESAFGQYVGIFNAETLAHTSSKDTKDEAAKLRWALLMRYCRILLSSEINMKKTLDGNTIKKHSSGGDTLIGRYHQSNETKFKPHYTLFGMFNDIPEIDPMDRAIQKRIEYIEFPHVFVDEKEVTGPIYRKKNDSLSEIIHSDYFVQGFIHIILDGYKDYLENGMPIFDQIVKDRWIEDNKQSIEIIDLIKNTYDITLNENDIISVADIKRFKNFNKSLKTISLHNFYDILKDELGIKEYRNNGRYWQGIRIKQEINVEKIKMI